jgi:hypothetical protein
MTRLLCILLMLLFSLSGSVLGTFNDFGRWSNVANSALAPAKRVSGSTVLGHHPEYAKMADTLGHRRFDIPTAAWDKMTEAQRWTANQKFLDRTISRGDDILLSTPLDKVRPGSYFERELQYMSGKGYSPSVNGSRLIPGGN